MMAHKQYLLHELLEEAQEPFQLHTYIAERRSQLNKQSNLCFFTPEIRPSPEINPCNCKSPANGAVFLLRIRKHEQSELPKSPAMKIAGLGFFGSFLKILKDRSRNIKRSAMRNDEPKEEAIRETRFCSTPFRFSPRKTPSSPSAHRTPDSCSPVVSPIAHVNKEKENYTGVKDSEEEEKEQCSPVSVLDPFSEDDDEHESVDADEDYDLDRSYANIQRARQQLLDRLRRFEKLAELDPMELEKNFLETSDEDDEYEVQTVESRKEDPPLSSSLYRKQCVADTSFVNNQVFSQCSTLHKHDNKISHRKLTDEIIELDFKREVDGWKCFTEQVAETAADLELAIFEVLVEELYTEEEFVLLHG